MANTVSRITSAGTYFANGKFDEVSYSPASGGTIAYSTTPKSSNPNLLISSNDYSNNTYWPKNNCSTTFTTSTTAPDGTYTAQKFIEDSTTAEHWFSQYRGVFTARETATFSFYAKAAERSQINLRFIGAVNLVSVNINLITGVASSVNTSPNGIGYSVTPAGNGWWRISASGYADGATLLGTLFLIQDSPYTTNYTGDGTSGIYLWGQQLEYGLSASNYVATDLIGPVARANTQLFRYTADWSSAYWNTNYTGSNNTVILTSATTAPDGSLTAYKFVANTGVDPNLSNGGLLGQQNGGNAQFTVGTYVTQSMFFKPAEFNTLRIRNNYSGEIYDFVADTTPTATAGVLRPQLQNVGNGWYRASWTFVAGDIGGTGGRSDNWSYRLANTGDGVSGIYIWGPQLQVGNTLSPFIATSTMNTAINIFNTRTDSSGDVLTINDFDEVSCVNTNKNLLNYSQTFTEPIWSSSNNSYTISSSVPAPDGSYTATLVTANANNAYHGITQNISYARPGTFSLFVKPNGYNYFSLSNNTNNSCIFNLTNGTSSIGSGWDSVKITPYPNGWYRLSVTQTSSASWGIVYIQPMDNTINYTFAGDEVSGHYIWGAQLEKIDVQPTPTLYVSNPKKNLLQTTENLTISPWNKSAANVVSSTELDPNGNYTASKFEYKDAYTNIAQTIPVKPNTIYTISVSAKSNNYPGIAIVTGNTTPYPNNSTQFSNYQFLHPTGIPNSGGAGFPPEGFLYSSVKRENNGYHRCTLSIITDATQTGLYVGLWMGGYGYAGVSNNMTLFGPQVEVGNVATPYQANTISLSSKTLNGGTIAVTNEFDEVTWNPPIVTANLTLNLDAANPASYNGGNTWYDTSGNAYNGTLSSNVTTSSSNYGAVNFDGSSYPNPLTRVLLSANGSNLGMINSNFTVEAWVNGANTGVPSQAFPSFTIFQLGGSTPTSGSNYALYASANYIGCNFYSSGAGNQGPLSTNTWYQIVQTYNYTTKLISIYTNGTLSSTGTSGTDLNANAAVAQAMVGNGFWGGDGWQGSIPVVRVYNKELSQAEINQNYNALAYRYNL